MSTHPPVDAARTVRDLPPGASAILAVPRLEPGLRRRLAELGLRPGESVRVLRRSVGGARIVEVHGSRIALDARTAGKLPIEPIGPT